MIDLTRKHNRHESSRLGVKVLRKKVRLSVENLLTLV